MNKLFSWCRKKMTKENMIVLALSGVLLMVVAIPTGKEKNKTDKSKSVQLDTQTVTMDSESNSAQQEAMEEKLAQFLSRMEGEVLITYASTEEQVIEKETPSVTNSQTSENDAGGTSRVISESSRQENTVYQTGRDGSKTPYVTHTLSAKVEGVTVLAQGGDSPVLKKNITEVIEALFDIEPHKIKVAKMADTR